MLANSNRRIARAFLPSQHHYWYSRIKLATDPLYRGVGAALRDNDYPLLDLGCGLGLLAHALRAQGEPMAYHGVDNDRQKISAAQDAAARACLPDVRFETIDLSQQALPSHRGNVAVLDVLQFMAPGIGAALIERAAACVAPGARLVIRSGLQNEGVRIRITRTVDAFSRHIGWMNASPKRYPTRAGLEALLAGCGLRANFTALHGKTPFNNWLVIAEREA